MSKQETRPQAAPDAIRVETATTVQGRAATTISVEVDEARLGQHGTDANRADRAVAVVSSMRDGKQETTEEELQHSGQRTTADDRVLKTFNKTLSAPLDTQGGGIEVKVETPRGSVWANDKNAPMPAHDADKEAPTKPKS